VQNTHRFCLIVSPQKKTRRELNLFPDYRTSKFPLKENERMNLQLGKPNVEQPNLKYSGLLGLKQMLSGMLQHDQPSLNNRLSIAVLKML
jgi:hypothetical protein